MVVDSAGPALRRVNATSTPSNDIVRRIAKVNLTLRIERAFQSNQTIVLKVL